MLDLWLIVSYVFFATGSFICLLLNRPKACIACDGTARAKWFHTTICALPWKVPALALLTLIVASVVARWFVAWLVHPMGEERWLVTVGLMQVSSVAVVMLVVLSRSLRNVRLILSSIADVLGFWHIRWQPLAGISYRDRVIDAVQEEVAKAEGPVVLVGHSQGSALSAWAIREQGRVGTVRDDLRLVTCGTPLWSLYATFFPRYFGDAFFADVNAAMAGQWANFWRDTDPIATPLPYVSKGNQLADPDLAGKLHVHGDYWIAEDQRRQVEVFLAGETPSRS